MQKKKWYRSNRNRHFRLFKRSVIDLLKRSARKLQSVHRCFLYVWAIGMGDRKTGRKLFKPCINIFKVNQKHMWENVFWSESKFGPFVYDSKRNVQKHSEVWWWFMFRPYFFFIFNWVEGIMSNSKYQCSDFSL